MRRGIVLVIAALVLGGAQASAQVVQPPSPPDVVITGQDPDFLRAQQYELQKDYGHALEIYQRLYERDGTDMLFWQLVMLYERTGDFGAMESMIKERLEKRPEDLSLLRYLAKAYYGQGNERAGRDVLNRIIGDRWQEQQRVYLVANELEIQGDLDGVVTLYLTAREKTGDADEYALELGSIYSMLNRYGDAAAEYLKMFSQGPQTFTAMIQQLIANMRDAGEDTGIIRSELEKYLGAHPDNVAAAGLLSDLQYRDGDIAQAYETLIEPAALAGAAEPVWTLAQQLRDDEHFETALRAFSDFFIRFPEDERTGQALVAAAEIRKRLGDTVGAVSDYSRLIEAQPGSELAAVASFRLIELNRDSMSEDGYRTALADLAGSTPHRTVAFAAYLQLASHILQQGDFGEADRVFMQAATKARMPDERYELNRRLAYLNYYRADIPEMITSINQCILYEARAPDVNDLLELKLLARRLESPADSLHFAAIGRAQYDLFRGDLAAAIDSLKSVAAAGSPLLAPFAAMELGKVLMDDDPESAVTWYLEAAAADADSTRRIDALMHAGDIAAEMLHDGSRAQDIYLSALSGAGGSVYDSEIRRKLREVMGQ